MRVRSHPVRPGWGELTQFLHQATIGVKQLPRPIALQPVFQLAQLLWIFFGRREGHLVGSPKIFNFLLSHCLGTCPALRRSQNDHWPVGSRSDPTRSCFGANAEDSTNRFVHCRRHRAVHRHGVISLDEDWLPAIATHQLNELVVWDTSEKRGVGNFVAVEVKNGQYSPIDDGIEEFVDVPGGSKRTRFGLPISHTGQSNQIGIIEGSAAGVGKHVTKFPSLMDGARGFRGAVGTDVAGEGELFHEPTQAIGVLRFIGIDLAVGAIQVGWSKDSRGPVARPREVDHVEVVVPDNPIGVSPDERLTWTGSPVA